MATPPNDYHPVERVVSVMYHYNIKRHTFAVEWKEKKNGRPWITPVFLEDLMSCPGLVLQFEKKKYETLKEEMKKRGVLCNIRKRSVFISVRNTVISRPDEYLPSAREIVKRILYRSKERVDDDVVDFYHVRFHRISGVKKMRLPVMEHYFPVDLLLYWIENEYVFN